MTKKDEEKTLTKLELETIPKLETVTKLEKRI